MNASDLGGQRTLTDMPVGPRRVIDVMPVAANFPADELQRLARAAHADDALAADVWALSRTDREILLGGLAVLACAMCQAEPLGSTLPGLEGSPEPVVWDELPVRAANGLRRASLETWGQLAGVSPQDLLRVRNLGALSVRQVVALAIAEELGLLAEGAAPANRLPGPPVAVTVETGPTAGDQSAAVVQALETIAAWGAQEIGAASLLDALTAAIGDESPPVEVAAAREQLASVTTSQFGAGRLGQFDVGLAVDDLLSEIGPRARHVLMRRTFALERPVTLEIVGSELDVTRERVRQIQTKAEIKVRSRLERARYAVLRRGAGSVRSLLGIAAPVSQITEDAAVRRFLGGGPKTERALLILWLAGPYRSQDRWLVVPSAVAEASESLAARYADASISEDEAVRTLVSCGFSEDNARRWLQRSPGIRLQDGVVMAWGSSVGNRAVALLTERGAPMDFRELVRAIPDREPRSIRNALFADSRVKRTGINAFGLSQWPQDEYTGIQDEIEQEIERNGGSVALEILVERLVERYGVSANSVRSYAAGPRFHRAADGLLSLREGRFFDPDGFTRAIEYAPYCYRRWGGWAYRLTIDDQLARGSGRVIPSAFAREIGLTPGTDARREWPHGEIRIAWLGQQPQLGSIRAEIEDTSLRPGDYLFLQHVEETGGLSCHHVRQAHLGSAAVDERLRLLVGAQPNGAELFSELGHSLGFPDYPRVGPRAIVRRLRARKEGDLVALVDDVVTRGLREGEA